jgi:hypothetical protein
MRIMGEKIERPVTWTTTGIVGLVGPAYVWFGEPLGEVPNHVDTVIWVCFGTVLVRLAAMVVLFGMKRRGY